MEKGFEGGREIVEEVDAEMNATDLIDVVRIRNDEKLGSGLETPPKSELSQKMETVERLDLVNTFYQKFSKLVEKHSEIDGKELLNLLSAGERPLQLKFFLRDTKEIINDTDWGKYLIKIGNYFDYKFPKLGIREEQVQGPEGSKIDIEIDDFLGSE